MADSLTQSPPPGPPQVRKPMNDEAPRSLPSPSLPSSAGSSDGGTFTVLKPGQGSYVRWCTALAGGLVALGFANFLYDRLRVLQNETAQLLIPAGILAVMAYLIFWLVGKNARFIDFMIATEGEMKKVNWSTRREVLGATRVVIFTFLMLGMILFSVDVLFMIFFESIGVLRLGVLDSLLGLFGGGN